MVEKINISINMKFQQLRISGIPLFCIWGNLIFFGRLFFHQGNVVPPTSLPQQIFTVDNGLNSSFVNDNISAEMAAINAVTVVEKYFIRIIVLLLLLLWNGYETAHGTQGK